MPHTKGWARHRKTKLHCCAPGIVTLRKPNRKLRNYEKCVEIKKTRVTWDNPIAHLTVQEAGIECSRSGES